GFWILAQQFASGHHHSRSAKAALQTMFFVESFLDWMQFSIFHETFYGYNFGAISLNGKKCAGFYRFAIQQNRACATARGVATDVCSGEVQYFSEKMNKE